MKLTLRPVASGIMVVLLSITPVLAQAPAQQQQPEFVKQGQQLMREGKPEEALALYRQTLQTSPNSVPANLAAGSYIVEAKAARVPCCCVDKPIHGSEIRVGWIITIAINMAFVP